ncbi:MAG TPA: TIM barrel protein [Pirellulales bacterium]|nr:TIM barrel protein [Pirellulales bacterium]
MAKISWAILPCALVLFSWSAVHAAEPEAGADPAAALGWKLAVHAYTFQKFSIFDAIDKTAALHVKYMSISGGLTLDGKKRLTTTDLSEQQWNEIKKKVDEAGLKLVNFGVVQLPNDEAKSRKVFEFAKRAGVDVLVAEPPEEALDLVEKLCKEYNIKVAIHDHPKPSHYWNPDTVLAAVKGRTHLMGACADTGHWMRSGLDPVECLKKLEGRVIALHFKDLNAIGDPKAHDMPWGTGVGKAREMLEELKRQKFHGAICVEYEYHWDNSSPEIAECVKWFNKTAAEIAAEPAK